MSAGVWPDALSQKRCWPNAQSRNRQGGYCSSQITASFYDLMRLSEFERKFVNKQEKRQSVWQWMRWIHLAVSFIIVVATGFCLRGLFSLASDHDKAAEVMSWLYLFCWFIIVGYSSWFGYTLANWHGDVRTRLLTKLVQEHDKESNGGKTDPTDPERERVSS